MRIDVHTHAQPQRYLNALIDSGRYDVARDDAGIQHVSTRGSRVLTVTPQMNDPAQRVEEMDAAGIDIQVLSLTAPQVYFLQGQAAVDLAVRCNDYLAEIVQRYPNRFRALASVPLTADIDTAVREYVRCVDDLGMAGFLVGSNIDGRPIDDPAFDPLYEEANRRGSPMVVHPMPPAAIETMNQYALAPLVGFMFDLTLAISRLIFSNFFGRFMGISVLAGHLGGAIPFLAGRLDAGYATFAECRGMGRPPSEILERLYLDTVAFHEPALRCAIEMVGSDHILFGSDYPHGLGDGSNAQADVERLGMRRKEKHGILGDNAARLFGLEG